MVIAVPDEWKRFLVKKAYAKFIVMIIYAVAMLTYIL